MSRDATFFLWCEWSSVTDCVILSSGDEFTDNNTLDHSRSEHQVREDNHPGKLEPPFLTTQDSTYSHLRLPWLGISETTEDNKEGEHERSIDLYFLWRVGVEHGKGTEQQPWKFLWILYLKYGRV